MNIDVMDEILKAFGIENATAMSFGTGLINHTWKVQAPGGNYVLQKINNTVFKQPQDIAYNIRLIGNYLQKNCPGYFFVRPCMANDGSDMIFWEGEGWFRLMPFVENSFTFDTVQTAEQAFEAAKQFGQFTRNLSGFQSENLRTTIPHFHDLELRYQQFLNVVKGGPKRIAEATAVINSLMDLNSIVKEYKAHIQNPRFKNRSACM